ncbi:MAG TPA: phosphoribosylformylglycinamidine cyclo-ligase [Atribacteraceae bacterium]|nr:phosphoribosylformylglycinamidine cyclo-ligase [Atribacteraceae bacterium]
MEEGWTYKKSGVDVRLAESAVERIRELVGKAPRSGVLSDIGGYAGLYRLPEGLRKPCLVGSCDGVGTKLKVAARLNRHDTVGIDLVAMCVNDILCVGARPLFFLDYYACGGLDREHLEKVVQGIVEGCRLADCALLGGETAEMPGMYRGSDYDLAGFVVGLVDQEKIVDGSTICPGDRIIGLPSSGLHSNGFSLIRKVLDAAEVAYEARIDGHHLATELLLPTRIYSRSLEKMFRSLPVKGVAHITGGGIPGNLPRILPKGCQALIEKSRISVPWIFRFIQEIGRVPGEEMWQTFNMGTGMIVVVGQGEVDRARSILIDAGERPVEIGEIIAGEQGVVLSG